MARIFFFLSDSTRAVKDATRYLQARGHTCKTVSNGIEARDLLTQEVPTIAVTTETVPPLFYADLVEAQQRAHPEQPYWVLMSSIGPHGEPLRIWPNVFDSYIMSYSDKWQIVLAVEQFLYRDVSERAGRGDG
jgi:hypothetical protein